MAVSNETIGGIFELKEVMALEGPTRRKLVEMVGLYTGFLNFVEPNERLSRGRKVELELRGKGIDFTHPAIIAVMKLLGKNDGWWTPEKKHSTTAITKKINKRKTRE